MPSLSASNYRSGQSEDDEVYHDKGFVCWNWQAQARSLLLTLYALSPPCLPILFIKRKFCCHICWKIWDLSFVSLEVYAAREKNGIYIPRDRYLQDEAEKKVQFFTLLVSLPIVISIIHLFFSFTSGNDWKDRENGTWFRLQRQGIPLRFCFTPKTRVPSRFLCQN